MDFHAPAEQGQAGTTSGWNNVRLEQRQAGTTSGWNNVRQEQAGTTPVGRALTTG
jgi:hypothetical protein